jgi:NAD(P)-dependent dehydrogenase (short-subunit alcohol dehydrogenase family)
MASEQKKTEPPQQQSERPGVESEMYPRPEAEDRNYKACGKLDRKVALITGGDSGIGKATAILFAKEGADIAVAYLDEHSDAEETKRLVEKERRRCILIPGDIGDESHCQKLVRQTVDKLGRLDILINNAAEQHPQDSIEKITAEQLERTFQTNIFAMFFMVKAALPHLKEGSTIVNTTSVTAYEGNGMLIDYSSTKGAIVSFTRSLSSSLVGKKIRVNAVAPGPIWTPLIPSTFPDEKIERFGANTPMQRPGQPHEVATCMLFLASDDSSYISGQVLHPNGGKIVNG